MSVDYEQSTMCKYHPLIVRSLFHTHTTKSFKLMNAKIEAYELDLV